MNDIENGRMQPGPLDERLDNLFIELELAVRWQRPSILLAVYPAEAIHAEAEAILESQIIGFGHKVIRIRSEQSSDPDISLLISRIPDVEQVIFFVDGLNRCGENTACSIYRSLNASREYFVEKQIRIVFWLTEAEAVGLAHFAPDFWASRHRVVDFIELEMPERAIVGALEPAWQGQGENKHMNDNQVSPSPKISLRETTQAGLPEWDGSTTAGVNLLLTLGIMHWRKGDPDKANESLRSALEIAIKTQDKRLEAVCFNAIALVKTDLGMLDEAVEAYEQAIELAPEKTFIWGHLGNLYSQLGLYAEAVEAFLNTLEHNPVDSVAWNSLGNAYAHTGRVDDAIEAYRKAVELNDCFIEPWISLGGLFKRQNLNGDAIKAFQKAAGMDPNNAQAWNELGDIYFELNAHAQAIDAYNIAIRLGVKTGWSYCNLASAYTFRDEYASAIPFYQKGVDLLENDEEKAVALNHLGDAYRQVKDYDNAIAAYQSADRLMDAGETSHGQLSYLQNLIAGEKIVDELAGETSEQPAPAAENIAPSPAVEDELPVENMQVAVLPDLTEQVSTENEAPVVETQQPEETLPAEPAAEVESAPAVEAGQPLSENTAVAGSAAVVDEPVVELAADPQPEEAVTAEDVSPAGADEAPVVEEEPAPLEAVAVAEPVEPAEPEDLIETEAGSGDLPETTAEPAHEAVDVVSVAAMPDEDHDDAPGQDLRNAQIWNELGNIYFKVGAYDEALDAYNKAIELGLELGLLYSNLGYACAHRGKHAEAIPLYVKGIELLAAGDDRAVAWSRLGDAYVKTDELWSAISAYSSALELAPDNAPVSASLDAVRERLAELDHSADENLEAGTEELPVETEAPVATAVAEQAVTDQDDDAADEPIAEDESDETVVAGLVSRLFGEEPLPQAVSTADTAPAMEALETEPVAPAMAVEEIVVEVAEPEAVSAEPVQATHERLEALQPEPAGNANAAREIDLKNAHIWNELGNIFAKASAFDDAIDAYNKATELDPGFGWPYSNLGLAYAQKGKFGEAVPLYQKSIERFDNNKDKAISWNRLGDAYRQLNEYDNAIAAYQIADELNQEDAPDADLREMNVSQASPIFSYLSGGSNDRF